MLANECKLGDKIKILNPGDGAYDCITKIGYITDKENTDGNSRLQDLKKVREYIEHEIKAEEVKQ